MTMVLSSAEVESEMLALAVGLDTTDLETKDDDTLIAEARWHLEQSLGHQRQANYHRTECGRRVQVLHDRFVGRQGRTDPDRSMAAFTTAVQDELGISQRHAYNLMELARPENLQRVANLDEDASMRLMLATIHDQRRAERRERLRAARAARLANEYPMPVELPEGLNIDVADCAALPVPDGMFDLIVTSPPYGLGMSYHESDDNEGYETYRDHVRVWSEELFRVAGPQGRICLNVPLDISQDAGYFMPHPLYADWVGELLDAGWLYRTTIVWDENNISRSVARGSVDSPNSPHAIARVEMIAVLFKARWNLERQGENADITHEEWLEWTNGLWTFPGASPISEDHCPAPFPEELPRRCMRLFSFPGDVVLDPFLGSGTSGVVAAQCGRQFYGFDLSALYVEQSRQRVAECLRALRATRQNGHVEVAQ